MERIAMSQSERDDLHWLKRVEAGSMTQREAAEKIGVTARWVRKLVKRMKKQGDAVVVHGLRGRTSNRKLSDKTQRQALTILKKPDWHDFGPTFAAEQLAKRHQIHVGKETLRGWMIEAGLWKRVRRKRSRTCTFGGRGERGSASWCSGTRQITIGSKAEGRCATWCG
jgi:transposase